MPTQPSTSLCAGTLSSPVPVDLAATTSPTNPMITLVGHRWTTEIDPPGLKVLRTSFLEEEINANEWPPVNSTSYAPDCEWLWHDPNKPAAKTDTTSHLDVTIFAYRIILRENGEPRLWHAY